MIRLLVVIATLGGCIGDNVSEPPFNHDTRHSSATEISSPVFNPTGTWSVFLALGADSCSSPPTTFSYQLAIAADRSIVITPLTTSTVVKSFDCNIDTCSLVFSPAWQVHGYSSMGVPFTITTIQPSTFTLAATELLGSGSQDQTAVFGSTTSDCTAPFTATGGLQ